MPVETKVVKGVKTINYKGKPYVEVSERVRQIHDKDLPFEVQDSVFYEVAGRVVCKVKIKVGEYIYHGQAEAKLLNAVPKSADETNPFECAETSAVGRALAFAGLGTVDGIASFDEIARSVPADELHAALHAETRGSVQPSRQPTSPTSQRNSEVTNNQKPEPASPGLVLAAQNLYTQAEEEAPANLKTMSVEAIKAQMERLNGKLRDKINANNGHVPTSTENAPSVKALRKRCSQMQPPVIFDQLVERILKANIPDDNQTPENCARLKQALDNIDENRAKKAHTEQLEKAS